jgi:hypothetical protein
VTPLSLSKTVSLNGAWRPPLAPAAPPVGPPAADGAAVAAPLSGTSRRGGGGKGAQGSLCAPSVRVDHSAAAWWKLERGPDGAWPHSAARPIIFKGVDTPIYNTTRSTPKTRSASGSLEVVHDEIWALELDPT